MTGCKQRHQ